MHLGLNFCDGSGVDLKCFLLQLDAGQLFGEILEGHIDALQELDDGILVAIVPALLLVCLTTVCLFKYGYTSGLIKGITG